MAMNGIYFNSKAHVKENVKVGENEMPRQSDDLQNLYLMLTRVGFKFTRIE